MSAIKDILFIHHSGVFGGASRSLGELIQSMPLNKIRPIIICQRGTSSEYFRSLGYEVIEVTGIAKFDITELGYYKGFRWLILLREIYYLMPTLLALFKARRLFPNIRLAHINDVQDFLCAYFVKRLFRIPVVLHVRGPLMQRKGWRFSFLMRLLRENTDQVITIDQTVAKTLDQSVNSIIIHNGLIVQHNDLTPAKRRSPVIIGMVSNMFRFKGILEFVEAAKICLQNGVNVKFEILGGKNETSRGPIATLLSIIGLQHNIEKDVLAQIKEAGLEGSLTILPFSQRIADFYGRISILCFPSHINAVGRPVFEAGFYKIPSIVAITDPQDDAIVHMETGICIEAKNAPQLASAIRYFAENPTEIERMGSNAFRLAQSNYDIKENARKVIDIYNRLLQSNYDESPARERSRVTLRSERH